MSPSTCVSGCLTGTRELVAPISGLPLSGLPPYRLGAHSRESERGKWRHAPVARAHHRLSDEWPTGIGEDPSKADKDPHRPAGGGSITHSGNPETRWRKGLREALACSQTTPYPSAQAAGSRGVGLGAHPPLS